MNGIIRRTIHPVTKVLDKAKGIVEYVASDETLDSYSEIIRADGWRFTHFVKNAPFVDSHDYSTVEKLLGKVLDFRVDGRKLIETVQWAKDVAENKLAVMGWKMVEGGFLPAVSVGFQALNWVGPSSGADFKKQLADLGLAPDAPVRRIFTEQEQFELSAVILGANPNALARAYKANAISDADIDWLSAKQFSSATTPRTNDSAADDPDAAANESLRRARAEWLPKFEQLINKL